MKTFNQIQIRFSTDFEKAYFIENAENVDRVTKDLDLSNKKVRRAIVDYNYYGNAPTIDLLIDNFDMYEMSGNELFLMDVEMKEDEAEKNRKEKENQQAKREFEQKAREFCKTEIDKLNETIEKLKSEIEKLQSLIPEEKSKSYRFLKNCGYTEIEWDDDNYVDGEDYYEDLETAIGVFPQRIWIDLANNNKKIYVVETKEAYFKVR